MIPARYGGMEEKNDASGEEHEDDRRIGWLVQWTRQTDVMR